MYSCHVSLLSNTQGSFVRFIVKTGLDKIVAHLTNNSLFKKRFFNRPIRFPGSNFDSGEINGNVIGSAHSKDLKRFPVRTAQSQNPNVYRTRWNANRCYSLRTTYLIFETFQSPFPTDSLIFTAVKLFHEVK